MEINIMIREVIIPQYTSFSINIPTSYIDRELEFIMFPLDEQEITLEDNAWKNHTIEKFKKI
jgi:hypothetical protein